ncbi:MAG TPA: hypothetical protein VFG43_10080 [Geminicoccaceae bacterium]|nr:hypothetical protein [Geminicoccaceae bacterium]
MKPMPIAVAPLAMAALLAGAAIVAGLALALPVLAAFAPPGADAEAGS